MTTVANKKAKLTPLSRSMLQSVDGVKIPTYETSKLTEGILHLGVGNFHRSHLATYMDDLFRQDFDNNKDWAIVGAGIMSFDAKKRGVLQAQDWMQTLVAKDATTADARVIGCMVDYIQVDSEKKEHAALREKLASPSIKIVSLTVTEGGYYLHDGKFDTTHPDLQHDIKNPDTPHTIFGLLVQALKTRRQNGVQPFTVMSCDNIPHNGAIAREAVIGLAREMDAELADWIDKEGAFPNCMVDRITPATTTAMKEFIKDEYGYDDQAPVFCEPFRQWVVEDKFVLGRPKWDQLDSVTFVPDVGPFETMKLRILNGGHASLCYPAALLNVDYVHEAMEHKVIGPFLEILEKNEIIPNVPAVPDTDLYDYWKTTAGRFSNPTLMDTIDRNCEDGANRQPKFIVPTAKDALEAGTKIDGLAMVSALWCRYCQGTRENGEEIKSSDKRWDQLQKLAKEAKSDPVCWLGQKDVYGKVGENEVFQKAFVKAFQSIEKNGVEGALTEYIKSYD